MATYTYSASSLKGATVTGAGDDGIVVSSGIASLTAQDLAGVIGISSIALNTVGSHVLALPASLVTNVTASAISVTTTSTLGITVDGSAVISKALNLTGSLGHDTLTGGLATDTLEGGDGQDLLLAGEGNAGDWVFGGDGGDTIWGFGGLDTLFGGQGEDVIYGNQGNDLLHAEDGNDTAFGGQGADTIFAGNGSDIIYGNREDDTLYCGTGADTAYGGQSNDVIYGEQGNDTLFGNRGEDSLFGGTGDDILYGNVGNDTLTGGAGADTLYGGAGDDTFVLENHGTLDVVADDTGLADGLTTDVFDLRALSLDRGGNHVGDVVVLSATANLTNADVVVLGTAQADAAAGLAAIIASGATLADGDFVMVWQVSDGTLRMTSVDDTTSGDTSPLGATLSDLVELAGVSAENAVANLRGDDFLL